MALTWEDWSIWRKPLSECHIATHTLHRLTWKWSRFFAATVHQLTAWAMAR